MDRGRRAQPDESVYPERSMQPFAVTISVSLITIVVILLIIVVVLLLFQGRGRRI